MPDSWYDHGKEVRFSTTGKTVVPSGLRPSVYEDALFESDEHSHQQRYKPYAAPFDEKQDRKLRRICGLSRPWFAILIAIVIFVAAVAGTVGAIFVTKAHSQKPSDQRDNSSCILNASPSSCSPTSTVTSTTSSSTTSATATPSTNDLIANPRSYWPTVTNLGDCPVINGTQYVSTSNGQSYVKVCGVYWDEGDLFQPVANSFDDCINACGMYNDQKRQQQPLPSGASGSECHAVGWKTQSLTCWLKSGTMATRPIGADAGDVQSAYLRDHWSTF